MNQRIGYVSQRLDGGWTPVFPTETAARQYLRQLAISANRQRIALPVFVDIPDVAPKPSVVLGDGTRVRWHVGRSVFVALLTDYATVVDLAKVLPVVDADLDALQALAADTVAWAAAGGVDAG